MILVNNLFGLPREIYADIMKQVPPEKLVETSIVSKAWYNSLRNNYEVHKYITLAFRAKWKKSFIDRVQDGRVKIVGKKIDLSVQDQSVIADNFFLISKDDSTIVKTIQGAQRTLILPIKRENILGCWESTYLIIETINKENKKVIQILSKCGAILKQLHGDDDYQCQYKDGFLIFHFEKGIRLYSLADDRYITDFISIRGKIMAISKEHHCFVACFQQESEPVGPILDFVEFDSRVGPWSKPLLGFYQESFIKNHSLRGCKFVNNGNNLLLYFAQTDGLNLFADNFQFYYILQVFRFHFNYKCYTRSVDTFIENTLLIDDYLIRPWPVNMLLFNRLGVCGRHTNLEWEGKPVNDEFKGEYVFCKPFLNQGRLQFYAQFQSEGQVSNYVCTLTWKEKS